MTHSNNHAKTPRNEEHSNTDRGTPQQPVKSRTHGHATDADKRAMATDPDFASGKPQRDLKRRTESPSNELHGHEEEGAAPAATPRRQPACVKKLRTVLKSRGTIGESLGSASYKIDNSELSRGLTSMSKDEARRLVSNMPCQLVRIQNFFNKHASRDDVKKLMSREFAQCIEQQGDPVLLYSIAASTSFTKTQEKLVDAATERYLSSADAYDFVLGDAIPAELKERVADALARQKFFSGGHTTARDDWGCFRSLFQGRSEGLTTGLAGLDKALGGGVSGLTIVGANEGDGKTSLLLNAVVSALRANNDLDCLLFTIDQPKTTTLGRLYSLVTGCERSMLQTPQEERPSEVNRQIRDGESELHDSLLPRMLLVEKSNLTGTEPISAITFLSHYDRHKSKTQAVRGMLAIDMFQSLDRFPEAVVVDNDKDDYRLNILRQFMTRTRSADACPDGYPVIVTSEIRKVDRDELTSNDLRGSARLGSFAVNIILLWPPAGTNQYADVVPRVLRVAKSRPGGKAIMQVHFQHTICRFTEIPQTAAGSHSPAESHRGARTHGLDDRNAL